MDRFEEFKKFVKIEAERVADAEQLFNKNYKDWTEVTQSFLDFKNNIIFELRKYAKIDSDDETDDIMTLDPIYREHVNETLKEVLARYQKFNKQSYNTSQQARYKDRTLSVEEELNRPI